MKRLADLIIAIGTRCEPYHLAGYMQRWWLVRTRLFRVRLHHILRSDNDRHLHDHPWPYLSIVLAGGYFEVSRAHPHGCWFGPGSILFRRADSLHRLVVPEGQTCWTLFIHFWNVRRWGFATEQGWVWWRGYPETLPETAGGGALA